jgi:ABC-type phosphate/phosphonate transport system permease subunit
MAKISDKFRAFLARIQASRWINLQTGMILLVVVLFIVAVFSGEAIARLITTGNANDFTTPTITPRPDVEVQINPELLKTANQTNAITIGAAILVLIIVFGVILHLRRRPLKP